MKFFCTYLLRLLTNKWSRKNNSELRFKNKTWTLNDAWINSWPVHPIQRERKKERKTECVISKPFKIQQNRMIYYIYIYKYIWQKENKITTTVYPTQQSSGSKSTAQTESYPQHQGATMQAPGWLTGSWYLLDSASLVHHSRYHGDYGPARGDLVFQLSRGVFQPVLSGAYLFQPEFQFPNV